MAFVYANLAALPSYSASMRRMLYLTAAALLSCFTLLVACQREPIPHQVDRAGENEMCGGIAGIQCADGLTCRYEGDYPDAAGTCTRS